MMRISAALTLIITGAAAAQTADSAAFIIRLGHDTTVVERYVRTAQQLTAEAVQRSPVTMLHRYTLSFDGRGAVTGGEWSTRAPGASEPSSRRVIRVQGDSVIIENIQGGNSRVQRVASADAIPLAGPFYTPYELAVMRAVAGGAAQDTVHLLPGAAPVAIRVQRVGRDSVALNNQFNEPMRAHVDARGRLLHLRTPAFTTVERLRWVDLDKLAREFAARDAAGKAMGILSPRFTARQRVGQANVWIDYSRPAKRGRPVWGALVPWGQVWRMGANDAAHLSTDRPLEIGSLTLTPGTYTLFLVPSQTGPWQLIVNRATGMSGLDHDPAQDVGRVALSTQTLARPVEAFTLEVRSDAGGGVLAVSWDNVQASVPFRVR